VERRQTKGDLRGQAFFALGYWAGCRVSEISWLQMTDTHVDSKAGWLHICYKNKCRDIDLMDEARKALYEYLQATCDIERIYVFVSQRSERLTVGGIYYWFHALKTQALKDQHILIQDLTFHNLQRDFDYRARKAGWSPEEVAHYLGRPTEKDMYAIETTIGYTQTSREQIKQKLKNIKG